MIKGVSAQPAMTNDLSSPEQSNARAVQTPSSNLLVLATITGKVRVLDSKGLLLESNLPHFPLTCFADLSAVSASVFHLC